MAYSPFDERSVLDVLDERRRQVDDEGYTAEHDDQHQPGVLALAGAAYAAQVGQLLRHGDDARPGAAAPTLWPFEPETYKQHDLRQSLVKAAALLLAELERFDRQAETVLTAK